MESLVLYILIKASTVLQLNPTDASRFAATPRHPELFKQLQNFLLNGSAGTWLSNPVFIIRQKNSALVQLCTVCY